MRRNAKPKICVLCGESKPLNAFVGNSANADLTSDMCKVCRIKEAEKYGLDPKKKWPRYPVLAGQRKCFRCLVTKSVEQFPFNKRVHFGCDTVCLACHNSSYRNKRDAVGLLPRHQSDLAVGGEKLCRKCGTTKRVSEFFKKKTRHDGLHPSCKSCDIAYQKQRLEKSPLAYWQERIKSFFKGLSSEAVEAMYLADPNCLYCRVPLPRRKDCHLDHKTARGNQGTNAIENLAICCKDCNRLKWNRNELEFRIFLKEYVARFAPQPNPIRLYSLSEYAAKEVQA